VRKNGLYLRLSIADGDLGKDNKDESNSIDNQRTLLVNFVQDRDDLSDEYPPDGRKAEALMQYGSAP